MSATRLVPAAALTVLLAGCPSVGEPESVSADPSDDAPEGPRVVGLGGDEPADLVELQVEVFDGRSGDLLPDAEVCIDQPLRPRCGFTDLDGAVTLRAALDPLRGRAATDGAVVRVRRDGYASAVVVPYGLQSGARLEVELRARLELTVQAAEGGEVLDPAAGHVLVEVFEGESRLGATMDHVEVELVGGAAEARYTDARRGMVDPGLDATSTDGSALLLNLAPGVARVEVRPPSGWGCGAETGWAAAPGVVDVPVAAGSVTSLRVACYVVGRVSWEEALGMWPPPNELSRD